LFGKPPAVVELKLPEARPLPIQPEAKPRKKPMDVEKDSPPELNGTGDSPSPVAATDAKTDPDGSAPRAPGGSIPAPRKKVKPKKGKKG
jgi:hypothetical protein